MKVETIENRIKKNLCTKKGEIRKKYINVLQELADYPEQTWRPVHWCGYGRYIYLYDHMCDYVEVFDALGLKYERGNDTPRRGQGGCYIRLTPYGIKQIAEWSKYMRTNKKIMVTG